MFSINIEIKEIDPTYNHIHHAEILKYLETARVEYLKKIGFPVEFFFDLNQYLVISRIDIKYQREVVIGDYQVSVEEPRVEGKTLICRQRLINLKNKTAVDANVFSMLLDGTSRRALGIPPEFLKAFSSDLTKLLI